MRANLLLADYLSALLHGFLLGMGMTEVTWLTAAKLRWTSCA